MKGQGAKHNRYMKFQGDKFSLSIRKNSIKIRASDNALVVFGNFSKTLGVE